jgi:hypothetical protein
MNVALALALNQKIYEDCAKEHNCEVLSLGELVPGAGSG